MSMRNIVIKKSEVERLRRLVESARKFLCQRDLAHLERLEERLDEADVVQGNEIPSGVVAINSKVRVRDLDAGREQFYTLVFPREADVAKGRISILAPIGVALLGGQVGDIIEPRVPHGVRRLKVQEILQNSPSRSEAA